MNIKKLVGMKRDKAEVVAKLAGYDIRVISEDYCKGRISTHDYRLDRINVDIVDEIITRVSIG